ncbi:MAG: hypothetical protein MI892_31745, partial [Desulfobacterales bacterium]|nr:hypothetical protein [Desulfobacterales bacterium]
AKALKAAIEADGDADMILAGKGAVDTETFQTLYRLAAEFNMPIANEVSTFSVDGGKALATRETGGGKKQVLEMALPCVVGMTKGVNEPRYPKFPDIMKAKKKEIKDVFLDELGVDTGAAKVTMVKMEPVPERSGAKMLEGSLDAQVTELVKILKEDEKVIA